ncbi:MAG TPA: hypothetical protein VFV92_14900, partial [Candidatus Bathyarchaeia archaeon]|nr:hypothetical protein [Candidatus Bathyarchaeia archaeon]
MPQPQADHTRFHARLTKAKIAIEQSGLTGALVIHHDEADGLCSGALTKIAFEKLGLEVRLVCLDKLYPEIVRDVESGPRQVIAYSDIGSGHVEWLADWNKSKNLILTLDHHDTRESSDPVVHNLNPELDGYSGEKDVCSSTIAYLFAKTVDASLSSSAPLAVIGSEEIPGQAQGLNLIPLQDGEENQTVVKTPRGGLKLQVGAESVSPTRASTVLNVLGSVGYYRDGPALGVRACVEGFGSHVIETSKRFEEERKAANQKMLTRIREKG